MLLRYQKRTRETKPQIKFVPTVFFDNYFNTTMEKKAESNLLKTICSLLESPPKLCEDDVNEQSHETFII